MSRLVRMLLALMLVPVAAVGLPTTVAASAPDIVDLCDQDTAPGHYACFAERLNTPTVHARALAGAAPQGYSPADLSSAYGLDAAPSGAGRRVFVIGAFDDAHAETDLATYRAQFGLPACTTANGCFKKINQRGATSPLPKVDQGWAGETSLDLAMVSAACPACSITLVEADDDSDNLFVAVARANALGARYVSMSWGGKDNADDTVYDAKYLHTDVVYAVSTGDSGYAGGSNYPASSPRAIAVGGTTLQRDTSTSRGWSETAWSKANSGCTKFEAQPTWQAAAGTGCSGRAIADVAAVADPSTGVAVYNSYDGGWEVFGGTSASAPLIAGMAARAGAVGNPDAYAYAHRSLFNDMTSGSNSALCLAGVLCRAQVGWDGPTGIGTPIGVGGFASRTASPPPVSCTGDLVGNPGFESWTSGWTFTGAGVHTGASLAHGGAKYASLDGTGHRRTDRISRKVTIPKGCKATLGYWVRVSSADHSRAAHDKLTVRVNGVVVRSRSNLARGPHYAHVTYSLSKYAGKTVTLAWVGAENASLSTRFYLDDVKVVLAK